MTDAFNLSDKFIFPFGDALTVSQLWQSDGTASGTTVFKSFPLSDDHPFPVIYSSFGYDASTQTQTYPLYNGKFFFSAYSDTQGTSYG